MPSGAETNQGSGSLPLKRRSGGSVDWRDLEVVTGNGIALHTAPPTRMSMHQGAMNSAYDCQDLSGNSRDAAGNTANITCSAHSCSSTFMTETLEPALGMHSFAGSLSPVPGDSGNAGPLCKSYLEPQLGWSEICDVGLS